MSTKTSKTAKTSPEPQVEDTQTVFPDTIAGLRTTEPFAQEYASMPAMVEPQDLVYETMEEIYVLLAQYDDYDLEFMNDESKSSYERMTTVIALNRVALDILTKCAVDSEEFVKWAHTFKPLDQYAILNILVNMYAGVTGK